MLEVEQAAHLSKVLRGSWVERASCSTCWSQVLCAPTALQAAGRLRTIVWSRRQSAGASLGWLHEGAKWAAAAAFMSQCAVASLSRIYMVKSIAR